MKTDQAAVFIGLNIWAVSATWAGALGVGVVLATSFFLMFASLLALMVMK